MSKTVAIRNKRMNKIIKIIKLEEWPVILIALLLIGFFIAKINIIHYPEIMIIKNYFIVATT